MTPIAMLMVSLASSLDGGRIPVQFKAVNR
jgi:hypothetical protein